MSLSISVNAKVRLALRRFLHVDRPVSPRSDDEIAAELVLHSVHLAGFCIWGGHCVRHLGIDGVLQAQRRPTYAGMTNTSVGLISNGSTLAACLAGKGYNWLFALSAGVNLVALVLMRWWVEEPRWARARTVVTEK